MGAGTPELSQSGEGKSYRSIPWWWYLLAASAFLAIGSGLWNYFDDPPPVTFNLMTGTENRILFDDPDSDEPTLIERFEKEHNVVIVPSYQGSVDTMLDIQAGAEPYDAVWPASSIWLTLGDTNHIVSRVNSIMATPVVFALHRSKAEELGWVGTDVSVEDILAAAESGDFTFMLSSATQSNSGAMAYLGYLYAFAGHPDVLTSEMLDDPELQSEVSRLLEEVDRTAGASGQLRDFFLEHYGDYDGMVNNESAVITANQQLIERGETDLLYVVYPVDGLAIADWPLGYINRDSPEKSDIFDQLQDYLLSEEAQSELLGMGRRTGSFGPSMDPDSVDQTVFNPEWGIDVTRVIDPITIPAEDVLLESLNLYQSSFRKPSFNVFCLDYSGSMAGGGESELEDAMGILLDQDEAAKYFLQRTESDVTIVMPFNDDVLSTLRVDGSDPAQLSELKQQVTDLDADNGTQMYRCLARAMSLIQAEAADSPEAFFADFSPAIILLTDGKSDQAEGTTFYTSFDSDYPVPVYAIEFGDSSKEQLEEVTAATGGEIYDGGEGLIDALRRSFGNT